MCRNIKTLHHFEPPATEEEVRASALQYVRKLTGMNHPSKSNEPAFLETVEQITSLTLELFNKLDEHTHSPPRTREEEKRKAVERGLKRDAQMRARYGTSGA